MATRHASLVATTTPSASATSRHRRRRVYLRQRAAMPSDAESDAGRYAIAIVFRLPLSR